MKPIANSHLCEGISESQMWNSALKKQEWELQFNCQRKSISIIVSKASSINEVTSVRLSQSELFELMHALLAINQSFNNETTYHEDLEPEDSDSRISTCITLP
jgi:hypothetical protein